MAPQWVSKLRPSDPQGSELLKQERAQSNIPVEKLSEFLFTRQVLDRQERVLRILTAEKTFDKSQNYFDGRVERFQTALARQKRLQQLSVKHSWSKDEYLMASELISEPGPYGLHVSMFLVRNVRYQTSITITDVRRSHCAIKVHLNSISFSSKKQRSTSILDAMHRRSSVMGPTSEVWRRLQLGILVRTNSDLYTSESN